MELLRNGSVIHTARPTEKKLAEIRFEWEDSAPPQSDKINYYYVRVTQQNGQMAWSSPIWLTK